MVPLDLELDTKSLNSTGMAQRGDWGRNFWSKQIVDHMKIKSSKTIQLRSVHGAVQSVNKELLCYFSPYYAAALNGRFAEARQDIFHVDLSGKQLQVFINWIYTGKLELQSWEREDRVKLYVFADLVDILALRRLIMTEKGRMERYREVGLVMSHLPSSSPYRRRMVDYYANHWKPEDDIYDPISSLEITIHRMFFCEVVQSEARAKANRHSGCSCCTNVCNFHEHEDEEEWHATCGQLPNSKKPEKQYFAKCGR
ncbi:hypothetical protein KCV07_g1652, partial [Aureobasidium melanogenum]